MPKRTRIALHDSVERKDVDALAYRADWLLHDVVKPADDRPGEVIWTTEDGKTSIHYVQDHLLETDYLVVQGPGADSVEERVRAKLKTVSRDDVLEMARRAKGQDDWIDALYFAGISVSPEVPDDELLKVFERGFAADSPRVRRAAVFAAGYAEWPALREPLRKLARDDPDPEAREDAAAMLKGLAKVWSGEAA